MQFNRQPANPPGNNNRYQPAMNQDVEQLRSRTKRQFLVAASGLAGGTALLLGGVAWSGQPTFLGLFNNKSSCTPTSGPAKLTKANPATITVCQGSNSIPFFPVYVAQKLNYIENQGLKMASPAILQVGSKVVAAVQADKYQIGNGVITDAFSWSRTDSGARIIGAFINAYTVDIVVSKTFQQETGVSAASTLPARINALRGKNIGITGPGSSTQGLLTYLFRQVGLDATKEVKLTSLGSSENAALSALKTGKVDALSFLPPIGQLTVSQGLGDILISPMRGDIPTLVGAVHGVIYTKQSTIDAHPEAIAAYIRAISQAEAFIQGNPAEAKVLLNDYLGFGAEVSAAMYTAAAPSIAKNPLVSEAAYNIAGQFHVQAGLVSLIPSYKQLVANSITTSALGLSTSCQ